MQALLRLGGREDYLYGWLLTEVQAQPTNRNNTYLLMQRISSRS